MIQIILEATNGGRNHPNTHLTPPRLEKRGKWQLLSILHEKEKNPKKKKISSQSLEREEDPFPAFLYQVLPRDTAGIPHIKMNTFTEARRTSMQESSVSFVLCTTNII